MKAVLASAALVLLICGQASANEMTGSSGLTQRADGSTCRSFEGPPGVPIYYNCQPARVASRARNESTPTSNRQPATAFAKEKGLAVR